MVFVWTFLIVGAISAVAQLVVELTGVSMPTFFLISIMIGAILTPLGVMRMLVTTAGGGFQHLIFDAGEAMMSTFFRLAHGGDPGPWLSVIGVITFLAVLGIGCGWLKAAMEKGKDK